MSLFQKLFGKNNAEETTPTLKEDIATASEWVMTALNSSGYRADYSLESMRELDRFYDEQNTETGLLSGNCGHILFSLGAYVGETAIRLYGGEWETDDEDPKGEINITVRLADGSAILPVVRCMKRLQEGKEKSLYAYLLTLKSP